MGTLLDLLHVLREQRTRTVTTLLGISWGTFSVIVLLAFGTGLEEKFRRQAASFGRGVAIVWPMATTKSFAGLGRGRSLRLRAEDILTLPRHIAELDLVSPEYITRDRLQVGERLHRVTLSGVYPAYGQLRTWKPQQGGRFLNDRDCAENRRVVVLGNSVKDALFGPRRAVGETLVLRGLPFNVVGVMTPKDQTSDYSGRDDRRVCLPAPTFRNVFGQQYVSNFVYRSRSPDVHARATTRVYQVLGGLYRFDPTDRQALAVWDTVEEARMLSYTFIGFDLMLALSGALTLLVGGVGVGNLMFIRVRQQTREIGIQMAVGARPRRILRGVLAESLILVATGGALGFTGAFLLTVAVRATPVTGDIGEPRIAAFITFVTILLLGTVGLLAGYFPARRAARLDPVRALAD